MKNWEYPCTPNGYEDFPRDCGHCNCENIPCDGYILNDQIVIDNTISCQKW